MTIDGIPGSNVPLRSFSGSAQLTVAAISLLNGEGFIEMVAEILTRVSPVI